LRTTRAARYSLLDTFKDQIRYFNAAGYFFEMHLIDCEDYIGKSPRKKGEQAG